MAGQTDISMKLRALHNTFRADLDSGTERGRMVRSAGMTAGLKVAATLIAFGASLIYARALGPHGYGLYAYVLAWVALLTIPASLGLPQYLVREGAKFPDSIRWLCRWGDKRILLSGGAATILMSLAVFLPQAAGAGWLFVIAAPLPLLNSLTAVRSALLRARGCIARSQWPVLILAPTAALAALAVLWALKGTLSPVEVVGAMSGAALLPLLVNQFQLRFVSAEFIQQSAPVRLRAALPFMWLGGLYLVNSRADLIMLGALKGAHDAGIYAVSTRAAMLVTFFLSASNLTVAPHIARLYQEKNNALLQRLLSSSGRRVIALSLPLALLFILGARQLLAYVYGHDFTEGAVALQLLSGAQLVNVIAGPTGTILNMTGHEKLSAIGLGVSVIINVILNFALIPAYGVEGAAVATAVSILVWNVLLWRLVRQRLGLRPSGIGL